MDKSRRIILVTGATGFIGRHAIAPLTARGFEVHAVARTLPSYLGDAEWHALDLLAPGEVGRLLGTIRPTHLLHLAWYAEHGLFWHSPLNWDWLAATLALLRAFADHGGQRFVGAGSCAEYDWQTAEAAYDEKKSPLRPSTLYGAAKASTFMCGKAYAEKMGFGFAWGRVFHLFGPGEDGRRIIPLLIRAHLKEERLHCGPGSLMRDFLPVEEVANAFAALCEAEVQSAVNIGLGQGMSLEHLSERISALAGRRGEVGFGLRSDTGPASLVPELSLIRQTDWQPPASLDEGLSRALEWWKARL